MNNRKKHLAVSLLTVFLLGIVLPFPGALASSQPAIVVSTPADNALVTADQVNLSGYVTNTSVLRINGSIVPIAGNGFFSYTVGSLSKGNNSVIIQATGASGQVVNKYLTVVYDPAAVNPVITVSGPENNSEVMSGNLNITGTVTNNTTLTVSVNGVQQHSGPDTGSFSIPVSLTPGNNTIIISAAGSGLTVTKTLTVNYSKPAVISGVGVDYGSGRNLVSDYISVPSGTVTVDGSVYGADSVSVRLNGTAVATVFAAGYFTADLNLPAGGNTVLITATGSGVYETREITIYYGPAGPQVYNVTPANGQTVYSTYVTVKGTVRDASSVTVNGYSVSIGSDGSFSSTVYLTGKSWNTVTIVATNSSGTSTTHNYSIYSETGPTVFVTKPEVGDMVYSNNITVSGRVYNTNSLTLNGSAVSFGSTGSFSANIMLKPGNNTLTVKASNWAGDSSQKSVPVIYLGGPIIYNLQPASGQVHQVTGKTVVITGNVANTATNGLKVNDVAVSFDSNGRFNKTLTLAPGMNTVKITATDGSSAATSTISIKYEAGPVITLSSPENGQISVKDWITITGKVFNCESGGLTINDEQVSFDSYTGSFSKTVDLKNVENDITVTAYNGGLMTTKSFKVYYSGVPAVTVSSHSTGDTADTADIILEGSVFPEKSSELSVFTINGVDNRPKVINGTFRSYPITLTAGDNEIEIIATSVQKLTLLGETINSRTMTRNLKLTYNEGPSITVTSPLEGSTVYSNIVTVRGKLKKADFNSLKIGDESAAVSSDGNFQQTVNLKEGKNEIELQASFGEAATAKKLTLYYNPVAKDGAEVRTEVKDGDDIKAFEDAVRVKLAKGSVGVSTKSVLSVADPSYLEQPPDQSALVGPMVRLRWEGDTPLKPYKVTLKYDDVVKERQAHKVTVLYYDYSEDEWEILGGTVDAKSRTVSVETDREGYFAAAVYFRSFDDTSYHWAQRDIEFLVARGAVSGRSDTRFYPDKSITRAEFVTFLVRTLGMKPYKPEASSFNDVRDGHWSYPYIEAALRAGLVSGVSSDSFAPDRNITREEAAVLLVRAGDLKTVKEQEINKIFSTYSDVAKVSFWAKNELASAIKSKLISGPAEGILQPRQNTSRAQGATMIARLVDAMNKTGRTSK